MTTFIMDVPDAVTSLNIEPSAASGLRSGEIRRVHHAQRRAELFAATRRRLGEFGHEKVTLRMLAADCDMSVQTIFNMVGNRSQLFSQASLDLGPLLDGLARRSTKHPAYPLALADAVWHLVARNTNCLRSLHFAELAYATIAKDAVDCGTRLVRKALVENRETLREDADIGMVANFLASTSAAATHEWARGMYDLDTLRWTLLSRTSLILSGALRPEEAKKIDSWLKDQPR